MSFHKKHRSSAIKPTLLCSKGEDLLEACETKPSSRDQTATPQDGTLLFKTFSLNSKRNSALRFFSKQC